MKVRILNEMKLKLTVIFFMFSVAASAGSMPRIFTIDATPDPDGRIRSNSIIDIAADSASIWMGTGRGISQLYLDGSGWASIPSGDQIGRGGVSALNVSDTVIWAATAYTENTNGSFFPAGGGVGYSRDSGESWVWFPQPVDSRDVTDYSPTTTNIQNVTYDIAVSDSATWITSWGGGLRRLKHGETTWEVFTPDGKSFSALANLSHRSFATVYANGILWVGTAAGIYFTVDEGANWDHVASSEDNPELSGNFVVAMAAQELEGRTNVWAATWKAENHSESYGLAVTTDNGQSWWIALSDSTVLEDGTLLIDEYGPLRIHNIGFMGNTVYAAADGGLWISQDNGLNWGTGPLESIYDPSIGEELTNIDFFSAASVGDSIFIGTDEGMAVGFFDVEDSTYTWRIHRAHQPAGIDSQPDTYAYPSPFSPGRDQIARFQLYLEQASNVELEIFSFAMEHVYESGSISVPGGGVGDMSGYSALKWNGRDDDGALVANGVYFYKITTDNNSYWGKVMVLD